MEANTYVDAILACVYGYIGPRPLIFSTFHPTVAILLALKQPNFPVFFLTEGGKTPSLDPRTGSLAGAVRFARQFGLLGLVAESTALVQEPGLVEAIRSDGLVLFTYGALNNEADLVRRQKAAGVDAVIVDSVVHIRKSLSEQA
jgi:glycerophosphodiester phosphodiesterase